MIVKPVHERRSAARVAGSARTTQGCRAAARDRCGHAAWGISFGSCSCLCFILYFLILYMCMFVVCFFVHRGVGHLAARAVRDMRAAGTSKTSRPDSDDTAAAILSPRRSCQKRYRTRDWCFPTRLKVSPGSGNGAKVPSLQPQLKNRTPRHRRASVTNR